MQKNPISPAAPQSHGGEREIADLARQLWLRSDCTPGRDLENWLTAKRLVQRRRSAGFRAADEGPFYLNRGNTPVDQN